MNYYVNEFIEIFKYKLYGKRLSIFDIFPFLPHN